MTKSEAEADFAADERHSHRSAGVFNSLRVWFQCAHLSRLVVGISTRKS
ncbi:MAG TPA: hypothetical protein PLB55_04990 [Prosthecobacter sp.]|jgi:hypothetical protein|nr:hypothetical protein [Prosthecobacter sp.]